MHHIEPISAFEVGTWLAVLVQRFVASFKQGAPTKPKSMANSACVDCSPFDIGVRLVPEKVVV